MASVQATPSQWARPRGGGPRRPRDVHKCTPMATRVWRGGDGRDGGRWQDPAAAARAAARAFAAVVGPSAVNVRMVGQWVVPKRGGGKELVYRDVDGVERRGVDAADKSEEERRHVPPGMVAGAAGGGGDGACDAHMPALTSWGVPDRTARVYATAGGIERLHPWQVAALRHDDCALMRGRNYVLCAPTSGGKTLVAEVAMLRTLLHRRRKVLVIVPFVSLCQEQVTRLQTLWDGLGIRVQGSYNNRGTCTFHKCDVAVATMERANALMSALLGAGRVGEVGLIVVDEAHMVGDAGRGHLLEVAVMKVLHAVRHGGGGGGGTPIPSHPNNYVQIVAMSATLPNLTDLSAWLGASLFRATARPVPLREMVYTTGFLYDRHLRPLRQYVSPGGSATAANPASIACHAVVAAHDWHYGPLEVADGGECEVRGTLLTTRATITTAGRMAAAHAQAHRVWTCQPAATKTTHECSGCDVAGGSSPPPPSRHIAPQTPDVDAVIPLLCAETVAQGGSVIVFVPSRKRAPALATVIANAIKASAPTAGEDTVKPLPAAWARMQAQQADMSAARYELKVACGGAVHADLDACMSVGVAFHSAGLMVEERECVERAFRGGVVNVLVATTTLAAGVNLPAQRILIDGLTDVGNRGTGVLTRTRFQQMAGRAGRFGLAEYGECILVLPNQGRDRPPVQRPSLPAAHTGVVVPPARPIPIRVQHVNGVTSSESVHCAEGLDQARRWLMARVSTPTPSPTSVPCTMAAAPAGAVRATHVEVATILLWGDMDPLHSMLFAPVALAPGTSPAATAPTASLPEECVVVVGAASTPAWARVGPALPLRRALLEFMGCGELTTLSSVALMRVVASSLAAAQCASRGGGGGMEALMSQAWDGVRFLLYHDFIRLRCAATHTHMPLHQALEAVGRMQCSGEAGGSDGGGGGGGEDGDDDMGMLAVPVTPTSAAATTLEACPIFVTQLGMASVLSSFSPEATLSVVEELHMACTKGLRLDGQELHLIYLLTPVDGLDLKADAIVHTWKRAWEALDEAQRAVSAELGVLGWIMRMKGGEPTAPSQPDQEGRMKRWLAAVALCMLAREDTLATVSEVLGVERGKLQALQTTAATHAGMVCTVCEALRWTVLHKALRTFAPRLEFGIRPDLADLMLIPGMTPTLARKLHTAGLVDAAALAATSESRAVAAATESITFEVQRHGGGGKVEDAISAARRAKARERARACHAAAVRMVTHSVDASLDEVGSGEGGVAGGDDEDATGATTVHPGGGGSEGDDVEVGDMDDWAWAVVDDGAGSGAAVAAEEDAMDGRAGTGGGGEQGVDGGTDGILATAWEELLAGVA